MVLKIESSEAGLIAVYTFFLVAALTVFVMIYTGQKDRKEGR